MLGVLTIKLCLLSKPGTPVFACGKVALKTVTNIMLIPEINALRAENIVRPGRGELGRRKEHTVKRRSRVQSVGTKDHSAVTGAILKIVPSASETHSVPSGAGVKSLAAEFPHFARRSSVPSSRTAAMQPDRLAM